MFHCFAGKINSISIPVRLTSSMSYHFPIVKSVVLELAADQEQINVGIHGGIPFGKRTEENRL